MAQSDAPPEVAVTAARLRNFGEVLLVTCAVVFVGLWWTGHLVVVGGNVASLPLLAALASVGVLLLRWPRIPRRGVARQVRVWISILVLALSVAALGLDVVVDQNNYSVLPDRSPRGCRVVAEEHSFLAHATGSLYLMRGGTGIARKVASFSTDESMHPFADGFAVVVWRGERASFDGPQVHSHTGSQTFAC